MAKNALVMSGVRGQTGWKLEPQLEVKPLLAPIKAQPLPPCSRVATLLGTQFEGVRNKSDGRVFCIHSRLTETVCS